MGGRAVDDEADANARAHGHVGARAAAQPKPLPAWGGPWIWMGRVATAHMHGGHRTPLLATHGHPTGLQAPASTGVLGAQGPPCTPATCGGAVTTFPAREITSRGTRRARAPVGGQTQCVWVARHSGNQCRRRRLGEAAGLHGGAHAAAALCWSSGERRARAAGRSAPWTGPWTGRVMEHAAAR